MSVCWFAGDSRKHRGHRRSSCRSGGCRQMSTKRSTLPMPSLPDIPATGAVPSIGLPTASVRETWRGQTNPPLAKDSRTRLDAAGGRALQHCQRPVDRHLRRRADIRIRMEAGRDGEPRGQQGNLPVVELDTGATSAAQPAGEDAHLPSVVNGSLEGNPRTEIRTVRVRALGRGIRDRCKTRPKDPAIRECRRNADTH